MSKISTGTYQLNGYGYIKQARRFENADDWIRNAVPVNSIKTGTIPP